MKKALYTETHVTHAHSEHVEKLSVPVGHATTAGAAVQIGVEVIIVIATAPVGVGPVNRATITIDVGLTQIVPVGATRLSVDVDCGGTLEQLGDVSLFGRGFSLGGDLDGGRCR